MTGPRKNAAGVSLHQTSGLYRAYMFVDGRQLSLGYFVTEEEASAASRKARQAYVLEGVVPPRKPRNQRCRDHFPRPNASRWGKGIKPSGRKFTLTVSIKGKLTYIGTFDTIEQAAAARDATEREAQWKK
jgi:hypothetical protein